jgi:ubiquitin-protein ligase
VLRIAYHSVQSVQLRMTTPVYHPTIGPQGEVAIIMTEDHDVP